MRKLCVQRCIKRKLKSNYVIIFEKLKSLDTVV